MSYSESGLQPMKPLSQSLKKYHWLMLIKGLTGLEIFTTPVLTLFFMNHVGLSFTDFAAYEAFIFMASAILEIPTGIISDLYGRKNIFLVGQFLYVFTMALLIISPSTITILISALTYPLGSSFASGNLESITFTEFEKEGQIDFYRKSLRKINTLSLIAAALAALLGGYLASKQIILPMIIDLLLMVGTTIFAWIVIKEETNLEKATSSDIFTKVKTIMTNGFLELIGNRRFLLFSILMGLLFAISRGVFISYQPLLKTLSFDVKEIGLIFSTFGFIAALASHIYGLFDAKLKLSENHQILFLISLFLFSAIMGFFLPPIIAVTIIIFTHQIARGIYSPIYVCGINLRVPSSHSSRTSLFSASFLITTLFTSIVIMLQGFLQNHISLLASVLTIALLFSIAAFISHIIEQKQQPHKRMH